MELTTSLPRRMWPLIPVSRFLEYSIKPVCPLPALSLSHSIIAMGIDSPDAFEYLTTSITEFGISEFLYHAPPPPPPPVRLNAYC